MATGGGAAAGGDPPPLRTVAAVVLPLWPGRWAAVGRAPTHRSTLGPVLAPQVKFEDAEPQTNF